MPAVRRRLLNLLTALSLLLCVAVCVLWVRSYRRGIVVGRSFDGGTLRVFLNDGVVLLDVDNVSPDPGPLASFDSRTDAVTADSFPGRAMNAGGGYWFRACGFAAGRFRSGSLPVTDWVAVVPLWFVALTLALPAYPALRRYRAASDGLCPSCGYDLRATPGRCPECGTAIVAQASQNR